MGTKLELGARVRKNAAARNPSRGARRSSTRVATRRRVTMTTCGKTDPKPDTVAVP
jgi:hypothetical protein